MARLRVGTPRAIHQDMTIYQNDATDEQDPDELEYPELYVTLAERAAAARQRATIATIVRPSRVQWDAE